MNLKLFKRIGAMICAAALVVMMAAPAVMAAGFAVDEFYPKDGATGTAMTNMDVKIKFNKDVYSEKNNKANEKLIKLYNTKTGKEVATTVAFNKEDKKIVLVLVKGTTNTTKATTNVQGDTNYTCEVMKGFMAADGEALAETAKTSFTTQNPKTSTYISFGMIGVMVVGMVVVTMRETKKKMKESGSSSKPKEQKVNPYKVAKETGRPVEEIIAEEQRKKARAAAKAKKKRKQEEQKKANDHQRVHRRASAAKAGLTYKTGKVAEAERKKAEAAEKRAQRQKSKNKQMKKK